MNGTSLYLLGKPLEAIDVFQKGIRKFPGNYLLKYKLARTAANSGQPELAESTLQEVLRVHPFHAGSHDLLGQLAKKTGIVKSFLAYSFLLLIDPQNPKAEIIIKMIQGMFTKNSDIDINDSKSFKNITNSRERENGFSSAEIRIQLIQATQRKDIENDFDGLAMV